MGWRSLSTVLLTSYYLLTIEVFGLPNEAVQHSLHSQSTVIFRPSPSLSIVGDPKDVKLKSSIDQLVRALESPSRLGNSKSDPQPEQHTLSKDPKKLIYGMDEPSSPAHIPQPITISSQAIQINTGSNKTGPKRHRSISSSLNVDMDNIKTIEGVRVPDDEQDKYYTWRNARVIKGFLVPYDKPANPQKKRQVVVHTDPNAYLAAAQAAQASGATTIIESSSAQQRAGAYAAPTSPELGNYYSAQVAPNIQRYQQQPVHPYQFPKAIGSQGGQTTPLAYAQQQGQHQMYVLQDGNRYIQYSPGQTEQPVSQLLTHSQSQLNQRTGEPVTQVPSAQRPVASQISNAPQIQQAQAAQQTVGNKEGQHIPSGDSGVREQVSRTPQTTAQAVQDILESAAKSGVKYIVQTPAQSGVVGQAQTPGVLQLQSPQNTFSNRYVQVQHSAPQAAHSGFVIQPQTYVTGPGGQTFTIPVPVPAEQAAAKHYNHPYKQQSHHFQAKPNNHNFAKRVMDALHINEKALGKVDTSTAVIPALASTGIFLGLSALAAGWYLAKGNREVGIVRRTGKPRQRRDTNNYPQEVDQATFFQTIIQQSLEKTQQQYENQQADQQVFSQPQEPVYNREPEPEKYSRPSKNSRPSRPQSRDDSDYYEHHHHKHHKTQYAQEKSGALTVASSKNFAKVFIPALILGLSVISITVLIFGWYITGANREIAFLEPASHSRKKRSIFGPTALADGWLQRTITAIHNNPYDKITPTSKSYLPHPFLDKETSKTSDLEFKISNTGLTGVLAGGALLAILALGLVNSLSEGTSRQMRNGRPNSHFLPFPVNQKTQNNQARARRSINNGLDEPAPTEEPGFIYSILSSIEDMQKSVVENLHESGFLDPQSPCAKKLVCEILISEDDDTIRSSEKHVASFLNVIPNSMSKSLRESSSEIFSAVQKRDCSAFACGSHSLR